MPTARIEIEFVSKQWVIQVEASSILRADRKTVYADSVETALDAALKTYLELQAKVARLDEGAPRELSPELQAAVDQFRAMNEVHAPVVPEILIGGSQGGDTNEVEWSAVNDPTDWTPEQLAEINSPETSPPIAPKRGRHPTNCTCEKCVS